MLELTFENMKGGESSLTGEKMVDMSEKRKALDVAINQIEKQFGK